MQLRPIASSSQIFTLEPYGTVSGEGNQDCVDAPHGNLSIQKRISRFTIETTFSTTSGEDSDASVKYPSLSRVRAPEEKHQLMQDYRDWLCSQEFGESYKECLEKLNQASEDCLQQNRFAFITKQILLKHPADFGHFCFTVLYDDYQKLEEGLASAYNTRFIDNLMHALQEK